MSRHARTVPTKFFERFARDACALADKYARGRIVSVLEGGYSDRALVGGAMAHLCGLVDVDAGEGWWSMPNLIMLEKAMKRLRRRREEQEQEREPWLARTLEIFKSLDESTKAKVPASVPPSSMTLRERKTRVVSVPEISSGSSSSSSSEGEGAGEGTGKGDSVQKRLPRVILRLGPDPSLSTT
ncbi:hypothetical protein C0992_001619 [Termitomyces sp. T32_za158]|nr:hypothetical protein C0992_001619 [Termitomyces sp. T32_za158]